MELGIPPELEELRERLGRFLEELRPLEAQGGEEGSLPPELAREVRRRSREAGFYSIGVTKEDGGGDLGPLGLALLREEIAYRGSPLGRHILGGAVGILSACRGEQRERYLLPVVRAEKSYSFALTEPRSHSAVSGLQTVARREGNHFVLNGVKSFVTGGHLSDFTIVVAQAEGDGGPGGVTLFLVDRDTPGLEIGRVFATMEGGGHCEQIYKDARLPATQVLGQVGQGLPQNFALINENRLAAAASAVGTAQRVLEMTLDYVKQPRPGRDTLADRDSIQMTLGELATEVYAARALLYQTAAATGAGQNVPAEIAMAKVYATEVAGRVVDRALQIHGGSAYQQGHPLEALYRQVRGWRLAEGATEVLMAFVGRELLRSQG